MRTGTDKLSSAPFSKFVDPPLFRDGQYSLVCIFLLFSTHAAYRVQPFVKVERGGRDAPLTYGVGATDCRYFDLRYRWSI